LTSIVSSKTNPSYPQVARFHPCISRNPNDKN
jgi:hypothetical protein